MSKFKCPYCDDFETDSFVGLGRHTQAIHNLHITKEIYDKIQEEHKDLPPSKADDNIEKIDIELPSDTREQPLEQPIPTPPSNPSTGWIGGHPPL